jgi:hypothetical protein
MGSDRQRRAGRADSQSLNRLAASATTHCMTGCATGEILGLVVSQAAGWGTAASIAIAILLAFCFGYTLTMMPLLRSGMAFARATGLALASDTASITVMEIVDNAIMLVIPGAMTAGLGSILFWVSMAVGLGIAWCAAFPVNRWLIARGRGPASLHRHHH